MDIFIKNMVCDRCIKVVREVFEADGLNISDIKLGQVVLANDLDKERLVKMAQTLAEEGFEIIEDKSSRLASKIKTVIIEYIYKTPELLADNKVSSILTKQLNYDYSYLSNLFCSIEGLTIERYFILQKVERIKELIVYDEMNLSEIADHLGYSSVQYLSNQFKKITGLTPSYYKKLRSERKALDKI